MKKGFFWILVIILFSIPAIAALLHSGFFQSDDGEWMIIRFSAFHQALRDGQFPVRFLTRLNYGYGYPVANFLYPGFMYLAEIPKVMGFSFVDSIKIILGLSTISSAVFVFLWLSKFFGNFESVMGSLIYLYAPYHLFDIYKRGSVGEILALAVVPFIFWQIERKSFFWMTVSIGFLIVAHNTLALIFLPLILGYMLLDIFIAVDKKKVLYKHIFSLLLGLSVSSFFWIPAIFDLQYTVFSKTPVSNFSDYFVNTGLIGLSIIAIFILTLIFVINKRIVFAKHRLTILLFVFGVLSLFFSLEISKPLWEVLPASFFQFPFRFLSIAIICSSFLGAVVFSVLTKRDKCIFAIFILLLIVFSAKPIVNSVKSIDNEDTFYATNEATTTVRNEYMPIWVKNNPLEHIQGKVMINKGRIEDLEVKSNRISFLTNSALSAQVIINTVYFPGWNVTVDGDKSSVDYKSKGLIQFDVPQGQHKIIVSFGETPIRLLSDIVSLSSLFVILFIAIIAKNKILFRL